MQDVYILIGHFLPGIKVGGPVSSIANLACQLKSFFSFHIITTNCDLGDFTAYKGIPTNAWVKRDDYEIAYIDKDRNKFRQIIQLIPRDGEHVLYCNPMLDPTFSSSIVLWNKFAKISKNVIVAPRGELFDEALAFKPLKKRLFLWFAQISGMYRNVRFHATNEHERQCIIKRLYVEPEQVRLARVISRFKPESFDSTRGNQLSTNDQNVRCVFLARISKDKNLEYAFDVFDRISQDVSIDFDIFGPLEDEPIWQRCLARIARLRSNIRVQYRGVLEKTLVRQTLANYDLFFMPTFAENFGHSIAESLSVGTPVLISDNTPWRNLKEKGLGWDLSLSAINEFVSAIHQVASMPKGARVKQKESIRQKIDSILNDPKIIDENIALFTF